MTRPRAQRPRLPETSGAQRRSHLAWNGGMKGQSRPPAEAATAARCTVDGCGSEATGPAPTAGMVPVTGAGDGAGAHWWCAGRCAVLARTRAELRAVPMRSDGGR